MFYEDVPIEVLEAACLVSQWFHENNIKHWKLSGCASRDWLEELEARTVNPELKPNAPLEGRD